MNNKKKFQTKIIISAFLLSLALTGCSSSSATTDNTGDNPTNQAPRFNPKPLSENPNLTKIEISSIELGKKMFIMGKESDDGNILASSIIVFTEQSDIENLMNGMRPSKKSDSEDSETSEDQPPEGIQRPNFEKFQNMSDEERQAIREQRQNSKQWDNRNIQMPDAINHPTARRQTSNNNLRLYGELITKDETSLTIKIIDKNSTKFVFYADSTEAFKLNPITEE